MSAGDSYKGKRIGKRALEQILERCSERDKAILQALHDYKYLLTRQVQRLYFREAISKLAALRATSRCLLKLKDWGLADTLKRRVGGVQAGSGSYVWALTPAGYRLLELLNRLDTDGRCVRKRRYEPSSAFLQHTLAVAEVAIQLTELAASRKIGLTERQLEPDCWRNYTNIGGTAYALRPDLYVATITNGGKAKYEDYWFMEVDLATESPAVVVRKCQQYLAYMRSGEEQAKTGVFPLVVWIVPDEKRRISLATHIAESFAGELCAAQNPFVTITLDKLYKLVILGIDSVSDQS